MIDSVWLTGQGRCGIGQCPGTVTAYAPTPTGFMPLCSRHHAHRVRELLRHAENRQHPTADPWPIRNQYLATCHEIGHPPDPWW